MKFILPLFFAFLAHGVTQENSSSIIVEDYVAFLSSTPSADEYYDNASMQDQIERVEEDHLITYHTVKGQENQPMLELTEVERQHYFDWEEASHNTTSALMFFPSSEHKNPERSNSEKDKLQLISHEEQARLRETTNGKGNSSSQQQRSDFTGLRESHESLLGAKISDHNETTPLLRQQQLLATYCEEMDRSSLAQETHKEWFRNNVSRETPPSKMGLCLQSSFELGCAAIMLVQPAAAGTLFVTSHAGCTATTCAKACLYGSLLDCALIIPSLAIPTACFQLHDAARPYFCPTHSPCMSPDASFCSNMKTHLTPSNMTQAVAKRCLDIKNCVPCFSSNEVSEPTNRQDFNPNISR